MIDFIKSRFKAFNFAFSGLAYLLKTQQAAKVHIIANITVFALAFWLKLEKFDWVLLILTVIIVWMSEIFNTAIEVIVDLITNEIHPLAKAAKDLGAAAVMITSGFAILIGLIILGPPLLYKLGY